MFAELTALIRECDETEHARERLEYSAAEAVRLASYHEQHRAERLFKMRERHWANRDEQLRKMRDRRKKGKL